MYSLHVPTPLFCQHTQTNLTAQVCPHTAVLPAYPDQPHSTSLSPHRCTASIPRPTSQHKSVPHRTASIPRPTSQHKSVPTPLYCQHTQTNLTAQVCPHTAVLPAYPDQPHSTSLSPHRCTASIPRPTSQHKSVPTPLTASIPRPTSQHKSVPTPLYCQHTQTNLTAQVCPHTAVLPAYPDQPHSTSLSPHRCTASIPRPTSQHKSFPTNQPNKRNCFNFYF